MHLLVTRHVPLSAISHLTHELHTHMTHLRISGASCGAASHMHASANTINRHATVRRNSANGTGGTCVAHASQGACGRRSPRRESRVTLSCIRPGRVRAACGVASGACASAFVLHLHRFRRHTTHSSLAWSPNIAPRVVRCVCRCNGNVETLRIEDRTWRK